jgi:hypothetical protein
MRNLLVTGSLLLAALVAASALQPNVAAGDNPAAATASASTPQTNGEASALAVPPHDPNTPYPLGPHPIAYEELNVADKAAVDLIQETVETSQPPASYEAWSQATAWTRVQAEAELAARAVGLVGTTEAGVVP